MGENKLLNKKLENDEEDDEVYEYEMDDENAALEPNDINVEGKEMDMGTKKTKKSGLGLEYSEMDSKKGKKSVITNANTMGGSGRDIEVEEEISGPKSKKSNKNSKNKSKISKTGKSDINKSGMSNDKNKNNVGKSESNLNQDNKSKRTSTKTAKTRFMVDSQNNDQAEEDQARMNKLLKSQTENKKREIQSFIFVGFILSIPFLGLIIWESIYTSYLKFAFTHYQELVNLPSEMKFSLNYPYETLAENKEIFINDTNTTTPTVKGADVYGNRTYATLRSLTKDFEEGFPSQFSDYINKYD